MIGPLISRGHPGVPTVGVRRECMFAVWNLDPLDYSIVFVALRSQIYEECPASWTFGSVRAPLLLVRKVLSARCLLAVTRETLLLIGLRRVSTSGVLHHNASQRNGSNRNRSATHNWSATTYLGGATANATSAVGAKSSMRRVGKPAKHHCFDKLIHRVRWLTGWLRRWAPPDPHAVCRMVTRCLDSENGIVRQCLALHQPPPSDGVTLREWPDLGGSGVAGTPLADTTVVRTGTASVGTE
jgi:hypothetical protein